MSSTKMLQYDYWTKIKEEIDKNYDKFNSRKPQAQSWHNLAIGSSLALISMDVNTRTPEIKSQIWIPNSKALFDYLYESKDKIESELGFKMNWERIDGNKASYISIIKAMNILDETNWNDCIKWHLKTASILFDVFSEKIKNFKL